MGRNLFDDPMLRRGELFVPNLHNKMTNNGKNIKCCYLDEKGLARLNEVWVVGGVVGGVVCRLCLRVFLRLGLLVIT